MFSAGSDICETKFKDHELEDESARASECWEASCGTEFGCRFFDRLGGQGRCAVSEEEDVMTPNKKI